MTPERLQAIRDRDLQAMKLGDLQYPKAIATDRHALLDYIDLLHEDLRITRLINSQPKFAAMHATCEDCGEPATFTWHSGPAANGGVEVSFGQCDKHAISEGQPGIDRGYLTRNY